MNGSKNSGTGQSLKKMTRLLLHSHKLDRSLTATLNLQQNGRQYSIAPLTKQPLMDPIQGISQMESQLGKLLKISILVLTKTISGSWITQILTTAIVLNCMSIACIINSLKCSASVLSLASSSGKILMATIKLIQKTLRLTKCSPWSSRITIHSTNTLEPIPMANTPHSAPPWRLNEPPASLMTSSTKMEASSTRSGTCLI